MLVTSSSANLRAAKRLLEAGEGFVRMVTLLPECDPGPGSDHVPGPRGQTRCWFPPVLRPTLDQLWPPSTPGSSMSTHLATEVCSGPLPLPRQHQQRLLSLRDRLMITFIADGVHVPTPELKNYLRLAGIDNSIVVSAAISRMGPGSFFGEVAPSRSTTIFVAHMPDGPLLPARQPPCPACVHCARQACRARRR